MVFGAPLTPDARRLRFPDGPSVAASAEESRSSFRFELAISVVSRPCRFAEIPRNDGITTQVPPRIAASAPCKALVPSKIDHRRYFIQFVGRTPIDSLGS